MPDVLDLLASLVDHSLLRASIDSGETRFSMLQTVRDYARSQLDPSEIEGRVRPARRLLPGARGRDRRRAARWRAAPGAGGAGRRHRQHPARGRVAAGGRSAGGGRRHGLGSVVVLLGPRRARRLESVDPGGLGRRRIASRPGTGATAGCRRLPRHLAAGLRHSACPSCRRRFELGREAGGREPGRSGRHLPRHGLRRPRRRGRRTRGRPGGAPARPAAARPVERGLRADRTVFPGLSRSVSSTAGRMSSTRCSTRRGPARTRCASRSRSATAASSGWPTGTLPRRSS